MRTSVLSVTVKLPSAKDFAQRYPNLEALAVGAGRAMLDAVFTTGSFGLCAAVTEVYGAPAVAAVAERLAGVARQRGAALTEQERKYCGALVCALMEANGYIKTGRKARVGKEPFSRGEVYARPKGVPNPFA